MKNNIGVKVPTILLPNQNVNLTKWAVVACDQFTSEPKYWQKVKDIIQNDPSTLNLIYPEVYLNESKEDARERINKINSTMQEYLDKNIFEEFQGFILLDRKTSHVKSRKGLVIALDLEKYDFNKGSQTLIRATENTIVSRLPPRINIRKNASIELPHIMVLIDDPKKTVIEPLFEKNLDKAYDFDLMLDSGHITGYKVSLEQDIKSVLDNLNKLANKENFNQKYGTDNKEVLLFAMGDGNHSLATAKAIWEENKKDGVNMEHPSRYALVELVNVHDDGLKFEPIHRVIFNTNPTDLLNAMGDYYGDKFLISKIKPENINAHVIEYATKDGSGFIVVKNPSHNLEVGTLQIFLDKFLEHKDCELDYIHGEKVVRDLSSKENNIGFLLPIMSKNELFKTVILNEALPRKTFSMGEASEKRFYIESRKIK